MSITASALAPLLFRLSPVDPILRSPSAPLSEADLDKYNSIFLANGGERARSPLPGPAVFGRDISRPSSTSIQTSNNAPLQQHQYHYRAASASVPSEHLQHHSRPSLPGLSSLTSLAATPPAPVRSYSNASMSMNYTQLLPGPTPGIAGSAIPVCQNCQTSTTPLWRRDESGSVLCNACGLFLKLHGRARPISLKTDVIKSRNRVKSANQGPKKKFDTNGLPASQSEMVTPQNGSAHRRVSQMASSIASDRSHSPISRTDTPVMHHDPNIAPQHMFDGVTLNDHPFHHSPSLPSLPLGHPSPGSTSSMNDRGLEPPPSYDQLLANSTVLRTRVTELEVINMMYLESEGALRRELDSANRNGEELKRRIQHLEQQLQEAEYTHPSKKLRLSDVTNE